MPTAHRLVPLQTHEDHRGSLAVLTADEAADFEVRRAYLIHSVPAGAVRGAHAHRELRQVLVPVTGSVDVEVDDGNETATYRLDDPSTGLYLGRMVWRELRNFSPDAVLLVLASDVYRPDDYLHDRARFRDEVAAETVVLMYL